MEKVKRSGQTEGTTRAISLMERSLATENILMIKFMELVSKGCLKRTSFKA